jgi:hypothetical protein
MDNDEYRDVLARESTANACSNEAGDAALEARVASQQANMHTNRAVLQSTYRRLDSELRPGCTADSHGARAYEICSGTAKSTFTEGIANAGCLVEAT